MRVESLAPVDRTEATRVLAESFHDYPYMTLVLRGSGDAYEERLDALIRFILDARFARQHPVLGIREAGALLAVATVVEPAPSERSPEVQRLYDELEAAIGEEALELMSLWEEKAHERTPQEPYHYLGMLGVVPGQQGKGLGGKLVRAVKDLAFEHAGSSGVCLNTELESNVALYRHLGFEVVAEADVEDIHTWCLYWRAPVTR